MAGEKTPISHLEQLALDNMEKLRLNPYPGRGIIMGLNDQGDQAIQIYWVMGRSENSRNRVLVQDGEIVRTEPFDASKVKDPRLIIYTAMRAVKGKHLVSNGDQTDTVAEVIKNGGIFEGGLAERIYEPDAPNFTPRITGEYSPLSRPGAPFTLSIIRKDPSSDNVIRPFMHYKSEKGKGECIHTYKGDGNPLPAFDSDRSYAVNLNGSVEEIAKTYWELLNAENRVALAVKGIDVKTGKTSYSIINQLSK